MSRVTALALPLSLIVMLGTTAAVALSIENCGTARDRQVWRMTAETVMRGALIGHVDKCLDVVGSGTGDGADIQQYTCGSGANQQWSRTQV